MTITWTLPRESLEWVGPIAVFAKVDGIPVPVDPSVIRFALVPSGQRPALDEWLPPVVEPGGTALGVQAIPLDTQQTFGIWIKFTDNSNVPVLDPSSVGHLVRS